MTVSNQLIQESQLKYLSTGVSSSKRRRRCKLNTVESVIDWNKRSIPATHFDESPENIDFSRQILKNKVKSLISIYEKKLKQEKLKNGGFTSSVELEVKEEYAEDFDRSIRQYTEKCLTKERNMRHYRQITQPNNSSKIEKEALLKNLGKLLFIDKIPKRAAAKKLQLPCSLVDKFYSKVKNGDEWENILDIAPNTRESKIKIEHLNFLKGLFDTKNGASLTLRQRTVLINREFPDLNISESYLREIHRTKLNFSSKRIQYKSVKAIEDRTLEGRINVVKTVVDLMMDNYKMLVIDESSLNLNLVKRTGFAEVGKRVYGTKNIKSPNITMIFGLSEDQIIAYQLKDQSFNQESFYLFIQEIFKTVESLEDKYFLFLDNCAIHRTQMLAELYQSNPNVPIVFNAPYSPELVTYMIIFLFLA